MISQFFYLSPRDIEILTQIFIFLKPFLSVVWKIIKNWYWLPLPFFLWKYFSFLWLSWKNNVFAAKDKCILLEVKFPEEISKPIRAMETVMDGLRQVLYQPPDWWEKWIDGEFQRSYSFEIVSIEGAIHFFIRFPERLKDVVEAIIYGEYPMVELSVAKDYTKNVPQDIPNKEWDLWGTDYRFLKPNCYPIKTYPYFEKETALEVEEERVVDPLSLLLESLSKIGPGEQLWVQIGAKPITDAELPWITEGKKIRDELVKRVSKKPPQKPIILDALNVVISGTPPSPPQEEKKETPMPEMMLTPGEKEVIKRIEEKIAKPAFKCNIRFIYLGKREYFNKAKAKLPFAFFAALGTENLNFLVPLGKTLTKIKKSWFLPLNLLRDRRLYVKKRKLFKNYIRRVDPSYPSPKGADYSTGSFVLNVEELATIFHFPSKAAAPYYTLPRIEVKGEPPIQLLKE